MLMIDEKKRKDMAAVLVAKQKEDGSIGPAAEIKAEREIDPDEQAYHSAAEDILTAFKVGSAADLRSALDNYFDIRSSKIDVGIGE